MSSSPSRQRKAKAIHHRALKRQAPRDDSHFWHHCPICGERIWGTFISFDNHVGNCSKNRGRVLR